MIYIDSLCSEATRYLDKQATFIYYTVCKKQLFNSLPNDKILDLTKLKVFADNKINVAQMMISVTDRVENIVEQERQIVTKYAPLTPSYNHPRNFIAIASIVLEICT